MYNYLFSLKGKVTYGSNIFKGLTLAPLTYLLEKSSLKTSFNLPRTSFSLSGTRLPYFFITSSRNPYIRGKKNMEKFFIKVVFITHIHTYYREHRAITRKNGYIIKKKIGILHLCNP